MKAHFPNRMSVLLKLVLVSGYCVAIAGIAHGMVIHFPDEYFSASFKKGIESEEWQGSVFLNRPLKTDGKLHLRQDLKVILHETKGFYREWKIDEQLEFKVTKTSSEKLDFSVEGELERFQNQRARSYFSDERTFPLIPQPDFSIQSPALFDFGRQADIRRIYFGAGAEYKLMPEMNFEAYIGPVSEQRSGQELKGTRMSFGIDNQLPALGIKLESDGWVDKYGSVEDNGFSTSLSGNWTDIGAARDKLDCQFAQSLQREFDPGSGNFNQRRDEDFKLTNRLSTDVSTPLQSKWTSELTRHRTAHIGSNADYMEFTWKNSIDLDWKYRNVLVSTIGGLDLQEQKYPTSLSNCQRTSLGLSLHYYKTEADSLVLESVAIRYRYDTPDEADYNDRDELRYQFALHGGWGIRPEYGIRAKLEADLRHLVYLFAQRSGENRWSRLFRLVVEIPWSIKQFENSSLFAIMSNYSDYDFAPSKEELSRVYRSFTVNDKLKIKFTNNMSLELNFAGKLDDHGRLHWKKWIQDVSENGFGYSLSVLPAFETTWYNLQLGWSWHERHTTLHLESDQTAEGESITSNGPEIVARTKFSPRITGELVGKYLRVKDRQRGNYSLPDLRLQLIWALG